MYCLINNCVDMILGSKNFQRDVVRYMWLIDEFSKVNVLTDDNFQKEFRLYWQLNPARLSTVFVRSYFKLLEDSKNDPKIDVEGVARKLYSTPTRGEHHTLQFSFSTKLIHMLRQDRPVYDSSVEAFYFLPRDSVQKQIDSKQHLETNLKRMLPSYDFLVREYARVLQNGLLDQAIDKFRHKYDPRSTITKEKIIDTLIWKFVGLLKAGAIREGKVVYT